jgi:hypothetical protein
MFPHRFNTQPTKKKHEENAILSRWLFASLLMKAFNYQVIPFIEKRRDCTDDAKMMYKVAILTCQFPRNLPSGSEENAKEY